MSVDRREAIVLLAGAAVTVPVGARAATSGPAAMQVEASTVEWLKAPVGIERRRPRFGWTLRAVAEGARNLRQSAFHLIVGADRDSVQAGRGTLWDSGVLTSAEMRAQPGRDLPFESHRRYWWSVCCADGEERWSDWAEPESFVTGLLDPGEWKADWIAARADKALPEHVAGQATRDMVPAQPLPIFRRSFALTAPPRRAILSICGLGHYALTVNAKPVGRAALASGWANYRATAPYDSYDVTDLLQGGANSLAVMLGNGMYNVEYLAGRYTKFLDSFGQPKLILMLTIEQADGRMMRIASDGDWRTHEGPIRFSSIYGGEDVDARLEPEGWQAAGFDDSQWPRVLTVAGPGGTLRASVIPPVVVGRVIEPVAITEPAAGVLLVDFGENFAGRPAIAIEARAGDTVVLMPAEALDSTGRADQRSFNGAPDRRVEFRYTAKGVGRETFEPRFTYHGFRYVEVTGVSRAALKAIRGHAMHTDAARAGEFTAQDKALGAIHQLIDRAVTSNMVSVLTDCPHREKLGWLEQTYLNAPTVLYNRDAITLYEKLVRDIAEAQQADGMVPGIAPEYVAFIDKQGQDQVWRNSPEWGVASVLAPWAAYRFRGDATILKAAWPGAEAYCRYLASRAQNGLLDFGMGDWYDIGPKPPGEAQLTSRVLAGTAVWIDALQVMARMAPLVGRASEAQRYRAEAERIAAALNGRFLDPATARYDRGSQTAMAMPLALGIVPRALTARATERLIASIRETGNGVTAGDIGFHYLIEALQQAGRDDVVLDMLHVRDRPSYLYQIDHGATTLTEAWDANPRNSLNHFMLGHAEGWLYGRLAGLRIDHSLAGPEALTIAPVVLPSVGGASASHELPEGRLSCNWRLEGRRLSIAAEIPAGRQATVVMPGVRPASLRENGNPLTGASGVGAIRKGADGVAIVVGSGRYRFEGEWRAG